MQILTVLKSGPEYKQEYLYRLVDSIVKHNPTAQVACLTDMDVEHSNVNVIRVDSLYKKWWGKLKLFEFGKEEPVLYLDIDTVCTGDLSKLVRTTPGFTMLPNVYKKGRVGSGVMSWFGDYSYLLKKFELAAEMNMRRYTTSDMWGDQAFIERNLKHKPDLFGEECLSYKAQVRHKLVNLPSSTKLVYFHGKPRPWQVNAPWM